MNLEPLVVVSSLPPPPLFDAPMVCCTSQVSNLSKWQRNLAFLHSHLLNDPLLVVFLALFEVVPDMALASCSHCTPATVVTVTCIEMLKSAVYVHHYTNQVECFLDQRNHRRAAVSVSV